MLSRPEKLFREEKVIKMLMTTEQKFTVVEFDIKHFKLINANYGESFGDEVLTNILENAAKIWGKGAVCTRIGADIFVIFCETSGQEEVERNISRLVDKLSVYKDVHIDLVFGVYFAKDKTIPLRTMMDNASLVRRMKRDLAFLKVRYYDESIGEEIRFRQSIEEKMFGALKDGQFETYYQPKYNIETKEIVGAEALIRWNYPGEGFLTPAWFIKVFEENGFIEEIDKFVLKSVCNSLSEWKKEGKKIVPVSVNVSYAYIEKPDVIGWINSTVNRYDVLRDNIQIEIGTVPSHFSVKDMASLAQREGYSVILDDFGRTENCLKNLGIGSIDAIKLDRDFIESCVFTKRGQQVLCNVIEMASGIGVEVIGKGVETEEQARFLSECGCKFAQGFYFSKPLTAEQFKEMLK